MSVFDTLVAGLRAVADIVSGIREARARSVNDALEATAAGRSAYEAEKTAGHELTNSTGEATR